MVVMLALAQCPTDAGYRQRMEFLRKGDSTQLVKLLGPPRQQLELAHGHALWVYWKVGTLQGAAGAPPGYYGASVMFTYWCKTEFELDADDRVVAYNYEGNDCLARELDLRGARTEQ
jgi:hypothetical protein